MKEKLNLITYFLRFFKRIELLFLFLSTVALAGSIYSLAKGKGNEGVIIAVTALIINILIRVRSIIKLSKPSSKDLKLVKSTSLIGVFDGNELPIKNLKVHEKDSALNYKLISITKDETILMSKTINQYILTTPKLQVKTKKNFERNLIESYKPYWSDFQDLLALKIKREGRLYNESKVSLLSRIEEGTNEVHLGKTSYFSSVITNEASTYGIVKRNKVVSDLRTLFPFYYDSMGNPTIKLLEVSGLSNHIGVNMLTMSKDNHIICWYQNKNAQHNVNKIVPTGAGSLNFNDIKKSGKQNFLDIVEYGMARELKEEAKLDIALNKQSIKDIKENVLVIGYFRWMSRGGKPDFIGISKIDAFYHDFIPDESEVQRIDSKGQRINDIYVESTLDVINFCNYYLSHKKEELSISLGPILLCLKNILEGKLGEKSMKKVKELWNLK